MIAAALAVAALLAIYPHGPLASCVLARRDAVVAATAEAQAATGVPPHILLAVAWLESRLGCDPRSGGCWGAPVDPLHRHTAGTHMHAARSLATSYRVCPTWLGAVSRFRCGICRCPPAWYAARAHREGYWPEDALALARRLGGAP